MLTRPIVNNQKLIARKPKIAASGKVTLRPSGHDAKVPSGTKTIQGHKKANGATRSARIQDCKSVMQNALGSVGDVDGLATSAVKIHLNSGHMIRPNGRQRIANYRTIAPQSQSLIRAWLWGQPGRGRRAFGRVPG